MLEHVVNLYAVDRAGNKSDMVPVPIIPLEPALSRVARTMTVKAGFASFFLDWKNELAQNMNIYVDFSYTTEGKYSEYKLIKTSNDTAVRWFIRDLELKSQDSISVKIRVEDMYGNMTDYIDKGKISLLEDEVIPKEKWWLPEANDSIGGIPMAFLEAYDGMSKWYVMDGIIDKGEILNFINTGDRGRTGFYKDGPLPWNLMIDLGEEYELSRIITHQMYRYDGSTRGGYYRYVNVGHYNMHIWDETMQAWDSIAEIKIPVPPGLTQMEYRQLGIAGDMAYFYPDDPKYTKPTRWFRYEALHDFNNDYTGTSCCVLSEVTLYAKKKNKN
jgi:hypothetical protein